MIIVALLASALACAPPSDPSAIGFWESASTSRGGIGHSIELMANGEVLTATTVIVDLAYRVADGKLFVAESAEALSGGLDGAAFTVADDVLVQADGKGGEVRKERLGGRSPGTSPLVGVWRYRHYTGAIAYERYTAGGRVLFRLPMTSVRGCYRATGDVLSFDTAQRSSAAQYNIAGETLTLRSPQGRSSAYRRAEPWYPRDRPDYRPASGGY